MNNKKNWEDEVDNTKSKIVYIMINEWARKTALKTSKGKIRMAEMMQFRKNEQQTFSGLQKGRYAAINGNGET